jgi:ferredoxin, 2Fe-2S
MPKITFIEHHGEEHIVEATVGNSVMQEAVNNGVPGIDADCGGACSCATCHVYVDSAWKSKIEEASEIEKDMLEIASEVKESSRLSCQINISDALDGLIVRLPENQL